MRPVTAPTAAKSKAQRTRIRFFRPGLEILEERCCPSGGSLQFSDPVNLNGTNGANPLADLVMDSSGNLYGTTRAGGAHNYGTVFEFSPGSGTITTLASFTSPFEGGGYGFYPPHNALAMDGSGNLYGTTYYGGANNKGTVYEVVKGTGTITTLATFNGTNGYYANSPAIMDGSGNLFSTTRWGGPGRGTLFEVVHGSGAITTLASFDLPSVSPAGVLITDSSGNLYGTTAGSNGNQDVGTVYEVTQGSGNITTLASFTENANPGGPVSGLVMDGAGNLYGTTSLPATVYEVVKGSGTATTLATLEDNSYGGPVLDSNGNLFGTTRAGGDYGDGSLFVLPYGSNSVVTLFSFNGADGQKPVGGLIMDSNGNFFGTTEYGGASNDGVVFELSVVGMIIIPPTLRPPTVGASYSQLLSALGGTKPYTFSVTAGALPTGLSLSSAGVLSGTPTAAGSFSFTVTANDSAGNNTSQAYTVTAYPASFSVSGFPSTTTAGAAATITVTALDANGNVIPSYQGTVHFTSSDPQAALPADCTFTSTDQGVHTFSATLKSAGDQSITATDTSNSSVTGSQTGINITPAAASSLPFSNVPASTTGGSVFSITLTATDAYGNTVTGYTGTVSFTSSDLKAVVPGPYAYSGTDAGTHSFSVTLKTAGGQSVTATDSGNGISGTARGIVVNPAAAASLAITGLPGTVKSGTAYTFTVMADDSYGNTATGYRGTVHFTSSDSKAKMPGNYTFTAGDNGAHTFTNGVKFNTTGTQKLTATDTITGTIAGSVSVQVSTTGTVPLATSGPLQLVSTGPVASTSSTAPVNSPASAPSGNPVPALPFFDSAMNPLLSPAALETFFGSDWGDEGSLVPALRGEDLWRLG
jgi:uncharacterized repeat protein (TIGR03803 family)